ncbi:MAG: DUF1559 domain-containing protein [Planctomycetaceae bacterium]
MSRLNSWLVLAALALANLGCAKEDAAPPAAGGTTPPAAATTPESGTTGGSTTEGGTSTSPGGTTPPGAATMPESGTSGGSKTENGTSTPAETPAAVPATTNAAENVPMFIVHAPDDAALVVVRPDRALTNPLVMDIVKEVEAKDDSFNLKRELANIKADTGFGPDEIEYLVVSVSPKSLAGLGPLGGPMGEPEFPSDSIDAAKEVIPEAESAETTIDQAEEGAVEATKCDDPATVGSDGTVSNAPASSADVDAETTTSIPGDKASEDSSPGVDPNLDVPFEHNGEMEAWEPPPAPTVLVRLKAPVDPEAIIKAKEEQLKQAFGAAGGVADDGFDTSTLDPNDPFAAEQKKFMEEMKAEQEKWSKVTRHDYKGQTLIQAGGSRERLCFLNSQTLLFGSEAGIQATIDREGKDVETALTARIKPLADRDFAAVVDLTPFKEPLNAIQQGLPFPAQMMLGPVLQAKGLTLSADLKGTNMLELQIVGESEQSAQNLHSILSPMILGQLQQFKGMKAEAVEAGQVPEEMLPLLPLAEKLVDGTTMTVTGDVVSLTIARPAGLEELPVLIRPMLAKAALAKLEAAKMQGPRDLAIAMHNFADTYNAFPANDRGGDVDGPKGLSWRVHLLPYIEQYPLYNEFHLDEPWDSEHNKTLIAKMPKTFGNNAEGKTSLHVIVGAGTIFGSSDKKMHFRDVTDGTSNTIMFVQAGDDTADIWTKPGGLTIDPENPIAALGNIGETFLVAMMDGAVLTLPKSIDAATLKNLFDHQDGNPVAIP